MGVWSSFKKVIIAPKADDAELLKLRAKHGIDAGDKSRDEAEKKKEQQKAAAAYDPWEEVGNMRQNFWFGSFASRRFKGVIGEEKLKARLAELEKKREAEKMRGEG